MPCIDRRRSTAALLTSGVALIGVLAMTSQAGAATIRACVKKHPAPLESFTARSKCRHGEQSLSWNTAGPKGSTGAPGAKGSNGANGISGANGAVAGFATTNSTGVAVSKEGNVLVSKLLPPGSYIVSAKAVLGAKSKKSSDLVTIECAIFDTPGTTPGHEGSPLDLAAWGSPLTKFFTSNYEAITTLPFQTSFSSPVATTIDLVCAGTGVEEVTALVSALTAVQVSQLS